MKAVILSGGRGTRLETVTHANVPKPMTELMGKPVLEHIIRLLARCGFTELCCTLACMPDKIVNYFGDGAPFGVSMTYRREDRPLGTAGAVKNCADFIGNEPFLVISGDAACDFDLTKLRDAHFRECAAVTMALYPHEAPLPYGLAVTDERGYIRSFIEKPRWERVVTDLVNTGIYILDPSVLSFIPEDTVFDFARDLFPRLLSAGRALYGLPMEGYWRDIGDPGSYYRANLDAWEGRLSLPEAPVHPSRENEAAVPTGRYACRIYLEAPHRARLMRSLSSGLLSRGADFTDGITLPSVPGGIHIAPCCDRPSLCLESDSPDTLRRFEALAKKLSATL